MVIYIARSGTSTISDLAKNTPTYYINFSDPHVGKIDLNFGTGAAGYMLESIIAHSDIM